MDFYEYQTQARATAIYPGQPKGTPALFEIVAVPVYPALGLVGEAGEVAEKMKKLIRDKDGVVRHDDKIAIQKELGDVLWYVASIASDLGLSLDGIANANLTKLARRQANGTLQGSGDDR